ncbi:MAG: lysophospholipase [Myxococcota bacterium]|nr:lysophospholipase [Myxococcota bacterium]
MGPDNLRRVEGHFEGSRSRELFLRSWLPAHPQRVLVLVHGFGEHGGRYEEMASWFARRGFAVYAHDQQGHGRSPGKRGHVDRFEEFFDDVERLISVVAEKHPGLSRALVGHSMGGLIVTAMACERPVDVDVVAASGPALSLSPDLSPLKLALARLLRRIAPRMAMNAGLNAQGLSTRPEIIEEYLQDPLVHGQVTAAMGAGMSDTIERMERAAGSLSVPLLLLHGESDPLCLVEGSQRFYANSERSEGLRAELLTYPGLMHEIFNEPDREKIYADLYDWVLRMEPT